MISELGTVSAVAAVRNGPKPLPFVDLRTLTPDPDALRLASSDFAIKNQVLPLYVERGTLGAGIGSEASLGAIDNLGVLHEQPVRAVLADPAPIRALTEERFIETILAGIESCESQFAEID